MSHLIDANVILRYLLSDNQVQHDKSQEIIEKGAYTLPEVLAEVVYVLHSVYQFNRVTISSVLTILLNEVQVNEPDVMTYALSLYALTSLDFVDCILIARNNLLGESVFSFDKKLNSHLKD